MKQRALFLLGILLLGAHTLPAQNRITGKVIDPAGKPVGNMVVMLHAVEESSGNEIDKDTSAADGTFNVGVESIDPNAVYFVAVVYNGQLFMGDLMRAPFPQTQDYIVQVGVNPVDLSGAADVPEVTPEEKKSDRTAGIAVVIAAGILIGGILFFGLKRRPPARRRWLVELARLEEELAADPGNRDTLQKRRAELRTRLRATASG